MSLLSVGAITIAGTSALLGMTFIFCLGITESRRSMEKKQILKERIIEVAPLVAILATILAVNKGLNGRLEELSWQIGYGLSGEIYRLEGEFIITIQELIPAYFSGYFTFTYIFGYIILLVFPLIAYLSKGMMEDLKTLIIAYGVNYSLGVLSYTMFIAYGPRNVMSGAILQTLYTDYPQIMYLTAFVNTNTNVFPSLHTSLSVTAIVLAISTHKQLPRWTPIALLLGTSVIISTMFLALHWLIDVLAGILLGVLSVILARKLLTFHRRLSQSISQERCNKEQPQ